MVSTDSSDPVKAAIKSYCDTYNIKLKACLSDWYDLQAEWKKNYIPNHADAGCYFIYDTEKRLLYIGKVSLKHNLGSRIASYFRWDRAEARLLSHHTGWTAAPAYVRTLAVKKAWEAPSLEEYLIDRLNPVDNTRGVKVGL